MKYFKISTNLLHSTFIIAIPVKDYAVAILILLLILLILINTIKNRERKTKIKY